MSGAVELDALLAVQDLDTALTQLTHRRAALPERAELTSLTERLADNERRASELAAERDVLAARQAEIDGHVEATRSRRKVIEDRLYGARSAPARDLQAMDEEMKHLAEHQRELEDAELEVMEAVEPLDTELGALAAVAGGLREQATEARARLATAESDIESELATRRTERTVAQSAVPADLLARYESLRSRLGGTGAARLIGSRCQGCHLDLPSMEVERIRNLPSGTVVTCDQCGRILVPVSGAGTHPPR